MIAIRKAVKEDYSKLTKIMNKAVEREELKGFEPREMSHESSGSCCSLSVSQ